jgi:Fe-S-cluster containining protein
MKIHIQENQKYVCIECGACCQNWRIKVTAEEEKNIGATDWAALSPELAKQVPLVENLATKTIDRRCVFLQEDKKCLIHAHLGYQAKPGTCRQFPLWVTETPEEKRVTASFFCPAVAENRGDLLSDSPELSGDRLSGFISRVLKPKVGLIGELAVEWSEFAALEEELQNFLNAEDLSVPQRVFALYHRSHETGRARLNQREVAPVDDSRRAALAQTGVPEKFKAGLVRALFLSFMEEANRADYEHSRTSFTWSFVTKIIRTAFGWGRINVPSLNLDVSSVEVGKIILDWGNPELAELMIRYFRTLVFRRQIFSDQGAFRGSCLMLVAFSLIIWYARACALQNQRSAVAIADLRHAVALVEKFFVQHNEGVQKLVSGGAFSLLFEMLLTNSAVAGSLVHL